MTKTRAIFEEASGKPDSPQPGRRARKASEDRRLAAIWFLLLAALTALMVLVGGATRLTESGLSITEWNPVLGALPPMSAEDWASEFAKYQETEQFKVLNSEMSLADFRTIYWWEWSHRQLGRLIGLVWAAGLVWLLAAKKLPRAYLWPAVLPGLLGGLQALLGWWMVKSGVEAGSTLLSVAPYRLGFHLTLAFIILALLVWPAWKLLREDWALLQARRRRHAASLTATAALIGLLFLQLLAGALVAGNDAGRGYTDWPLMNGALLPPEAFALSPVWRNFIEGMALTQFNHRILGYALAGVAVWVALVGRRAALAGLRKWTAIAAALIWAQMILGVVTVLYGAPFWLALAHQALAIAVVIHALRARFEACYPAETSIRETRA